MCTDILQCDHIGDFLTKQFNYSHARRSEPTYITFGCIFFKYKGFQCLNVGFGIHFREDYTMIIMKVVVLWQVVDLALKDMEWSSH